VATPSTLGLPGFVFRGPFAIREYLGRRESRPYQLFGGASVLASRLFL
jgi:hypothetical protein